MTPILALSKIDTDDPVAKNSKNATALKKTLVGDENR